MTEKQARALSLEDYLAIRSESRLATILFCVYTLLFAAGGFYLASQGGRYYLYMSIGTAMYLTIGMSLFIPPFHRKAYLELAQPELKTYPSKKGLLSSRFLLVQLGAYGLGLIVLTILVAQSLSAIQPKIDIGDLPSIAPSTTESSTLPPSLNMDKKDE